MIAFEACAAGEVGDGAGDPERAMHAARRPAQPLACRHDQRLSVGAKRAVARNALRVEP